MVNSFDEYKLIKIQLKAKINSLKKKFSKIGASYVNYVDIYKSEYFTVKVLFFKEANIIEGYSCGQSSYGIVFDYNSRYKYVWKTSIFEIRKEEYIKRLDNILEWFIDKTGFDKDVAVYEMDYDSIVETFKYVWVGR